VEEIEIISLGPFSLIPIYGEEQILWVDGEVSGQRVNTLDEEFAYLRCRLHLHAIKIL
jgi:hypothetical protein